MFFARQWVFQTMYWRRMLLLLPLVIASLGFFPSSVDANSPDNVHALVYSRNAAELFFNPRPGQLTRITQNGNYLGTFDTRSLFLGSVDPDTRYRYELQSESVDGEVASDRRVVDLYTGDFSPPVRFVGSRLEVLLSMTTATDPPTVEVVTSSNIVEISLPEPTPEPAAEPAPVPAVEPITAQPLPEPIPSPPAPQSTAASVSGGCEAGTLGQLRDCLARGSSLISIQQDISCSGGNCCSTGGATLGLQGINNVRIEGNGHRLLRNNGHRQCHLIEVNQSRNITFNNWVLDDNASVSGCAVGDRCPHMLFMRSSNNIRMDRVSILNSKGYATWIQAVDGFTFTRGEVKDSGVLGMYIGHGGQPSQNISITDSRFLYNQTNGLAVLGLVGSATANRISGNFFTGNHWRGQFAVAPQFGQGFTGGGQVYIAEADGLSFENNRIVHGYCVNCLVTSAAGSGVTGLELGLPSTASIRNLNISNNIIDNHDAWGIGANLGTAIGFDIALTNNTVRNAKISVVGSGYRQSGNRLSNIQRLISFEGGDGALDTGAWTGACGVVRRQCSASALNGSCVILLDSSSASSRNCGASGVSEFRSDLFSLNGSRQVILNGWLRGANAEVCLESRVTGGNQLRQCQGLSAGTSASPINGFAGFDTIVLDVPSGTQQARVVVVAPSGSRVELDDLKLAFQ